MLYELQIKWVCGGGGVGKYDNQSCFEDMVERSWEEELDSEV